MSLKNSSMPSNGWHDILTQDAWRNLIVQHPSVSMLTIIAFVIFVWSLPLALKRSGRAGRSSDTEAKRQSSLPAATEKRAVRKTWTLPEKQSTLDICSTEAPKFRPFRWGDYSMTMGIRFIPETQWLELYKSYPAYIRLRQLRHASRGKECVDVLPHANDRNLRAALELAQSLAAYLAARYPALFHVELKDDQTDAGPFGQHVCAVQRRQNEALGLPYKRWTLPEVEEYGMDGILTDPCYVNPMQVAGELIPDDVALLLPDDGAQPDERGAMEYRLIAGSICTAGFWRLKDKLGMTLQSIHETGKVPQYAERLRDPLDRFFTKMERGGDRLAERNNYFFQIVRRGDSLTKVYQLRDGTLISNLEASPDDDQKVALDDRTELTWGLSTNGPEDLYDASTKGPQADSGPVTVPTDEGQVALEEPIRNPEDVVMRTERQTLRKLPKSGAVVFTIHTHMVPIALMADEPGVPGRLAHAMRSWPDKVAWYKAADLYRDVVLPYLDAKHEQQIRSDVVQSQEKEQEKSRKAYPL